PLCSTRLASSEIYTLSLHDALPILPESGFEEPMYEQPVVIVPSLPVQREFDASTQNQPQGRVPHLVELPLSFQKSVPDLTFNSQDRKSTRLNSSHVKISYAVFCLKK